MPDPNTQTADQTAPAATDQQTPPTTDDPTGTNGGQGEEKRFTQAELEAKISDRLKRERELAATKAQKDKDAAEAEQLKVQAKWQELATQHEAKVKDLEPQVETLTAERDRLVAIVTAAIDAETRDWAKEVKELLPADADVLTRYAAVERTRGLAARLNATGPLPGNGPNPRPTGAASDGVQTIVEQNRGRGIYTPF